MLVGLLLRRRPELGEAGAHFGETCGMGEDPGEIDFLVRILGQVEELRNPFHFHKFFVCQLL